MKVLLSVFSCNPLHGSDAFVGWAFVKNMSQYHEIFALTRSENKNDIEQYCRDNKMNLGNVHFYYIDQSRLFIEKIYKVNRYFGFLGSYFVWQKSAYRLAKKLHLIYNFDICHHISIADFRCAGYLYRLGIPYIFGPVGGGQETPKCLRTYIKGHKKGELFRTMMNRFTTRLPNYKRALHFASVIYSSNDETSECISKRMKAEDRYKLQQMTELCIDRSYLNDRTNLHRSNNEVVHIVVSGRLIYRKGVRILLDAIPFIKVKHKYVIDIYGDGDQREKLKRYIVENNLEGIVNFHGKIPYKQMQQAYLEADIYVLPSLRETTGTAVFEALANKLPVITFNQNGAKYIVQDDAGILVQLTDREHILKDLAGAMSKLIDDYDLRISLGERGYQKLKENYTWEKRASEITRVYEKIKKEEIF